MQQNKPIRASKAHQLAPCILFVPSVQKVKCENNNSTIYVLAGLFVSKQLPGNLHTLREVYIPGQEIVRFVMLGLI